MAQSPVLAEQIVRRGIWTDHNGSGPSILMADFSAAVWAAMLAVCFTLAGAYLPKIVLCTVTLLQSYKSQSEDDPNEGDRLLGASQPSNSLNRSQLQTTRRVLQESAHGSNRDFYVRAGKHISRSRSYDSLILVIVGMFLFLIWIAYTIAGVFSSAGIYTDRVALWSSSNCGIWLFDSENAGPAAATRADIYDRGKESRAGEYAKSCYEASNALQSMNCNFFYQPTINFSTSYSFQCPFQEIDRKVCIEGSPAVTFDTGVIDASQIGVNDISPYKFRRSTTCSPLSVDNHYVRSEDSNGTTTLRYYYGRIINGDQSTDHTYLSSGNPFDWLVPAYEVSIYATSPYPELDYWKPIPELTPPKNSTLTILFISPMHIFYVEPSTDPIFPANKAHYFEDDPDPWYIKSDAKARVLACIDNSELCSPDGQTCWSMTEQRDDLPPSYWLMKLSLEMSNTYDSIARRLGAALIAQEKVSQFNSAPLPEAHWVAEAKRLFATSLARIQFDAWNIASGEDWVHEGADGYVPFTPDEAGDLCGLFKFRSTGWLNISLLKFVVLLLVPPCIWVLSWDGKEVMADTKAFYAWVRRRPPSETDPEIAAEEGPQAGYGTVNNAGGSSQNAPDGEPAQEEQTEARRPRDGSKSRVLVIHYLLWALWCFLAKIIPDLAVRLYRNISQRRSEGQV